MPPVRKGKKKKAVTLYSRPRSWTVPGHDFLVLGTDIERLKYAVPRNKLDQVAKIHDLNYGNKHISTVDTKEYWIIWCSI